MSSKNNSVVGEFTKTTKAVDRNSASLLSPTRAAIEAFSAKLVGNNCVRPEQGPHIINATNVDTEALLGDISLRSAISSLRQQSNEAIEVSLGQAGLLEEPNVTYHVMQFIWIGTSFNDDAEVAPENGVFTGLAHLVPSSLRIIFDTPTPFYLPVISTPGYAHSVYLHANTYDKARCALLLSFCVVSLVPPSAASSLTMKYATIGATNQSGEEKRIFPGTISTSMTDARIDGIQEVDESDIVVYDILASHASDTYSSLFRVELTSYTPDNSVYFKVKPLGETITITQDDMGNPFNMYLSQGYPVNMPCSIMWGQIVSGEVVVSSQYDYDFDMLFPSVPAIESSGTPAVVTITRDGTGDEGEADNTSILYSTNGNPPHIPYDPDNKPIVSESCTFLSQICPNYGVTTWGYSPVVAHEIILADATLPDPVILPNGGIYAQLPTIRVTMPLPNLGVYALRYKWMAMDECAPEDPNDWTGTGWHILSTSSITNTIQALDHSGDTPSLFVGFTKTGWTASSKRTLFRIEEEAQRKSGATILDDGFDAKLVKRKIEAFFVENSGGGIYSAVFNFMPFTEPAVLPMEDIPEDTIEQRSRQRRYPAMSQVFLVTPSISRGGAAGINHRVSMLFKHEARLRKQLLQTLPSAPIDVIDRFKTKYVSTIYEDTFMRINLNVYYDLGSAEDVLDTYAYCFSVVDIPNGYETFPNNFSSGLVHTKDIVATRVVVVDELDTGTARLVIEYLIDDVRAIAYLSLENLSNLYPDMSSVRTPIYVLSEVIVYVDGSFPPLPSHIDRLEAESDRLAAGYLPSFYSSPATGETIGDTLSVAHVGLWSCVQQKAVLGRLVHGNPLAVRIDGKYNAVQTVASYGAHMLFGSQYHSTAGVFVWKDGLEIVSPTVALPQVLPFKLWAPRLFIQYALSVDDQGWEWNPQDNTLFVDWTETESLFDKDQDIIKVKNASSQVAALLRSSWHDIPFVFGNASMLKTGTIYSVAPPALLAGGAYDEALSSEEVLGINLIASKILYGSHENAGVVMTSSGLYTSSSWPYMSDSKRRVSALGVSEQITMLDNFIFSRENGYVCVYFVNEKQGKTLLFNEYGDLAQHPMVYNGEPYFAIQNGTSARLYKGSQQGVIPLREETADHSFLLHRTGADPAWYTFYGDKYTVWILDTNSVSKCDEIASEALTAVEIIAPGRKTHKLVSATSEFVDYVKNVTEYTVECDDIFPSALSFEYEQYTFIVNGIVLRFRNRGTATSPVSVAVTVDKVKVLNVVNHMMSQPEVIIPIDATIAHSLSYTIKARLPLRSVRFLGYFVEDLKVE